VPVPEKKTKVEFKTLPLSPPFGKSAAAIKVTQEAPKLIDFLMQFVDEIRELRDTKDQYLAGIKDMKEKIDREYPALISQKEAEKAAAEREVVILKERIKILEKLNAQQTEDIKNLKRHPKFAGMVKKGEHNGNIPDPIFR